MRTKVTNRVQKVIPPAMRERHGNKRGYFMEWIADGQVIKVIPIPADPIKMLRGSAREEKLRESRREN